MSDPTSSPSVPSLISGTGGDQQPTTGAYAPFTYVGVDARGTARTGTASDKPEVFVESRFDAGWRRLEATRGGVCVGIIGRRAGRRIWWADASERGESREVRDA